jgi:hypothetical protein
MHTEFHMEPTEADIRQMREAFGFDDIFLEFTEERKGELFEGVLTIRRVMELSEDVEEAHETTKRTRYARKLQSVLERLIEVLNEEEGNPHLLQAMAKMRDAHGLTSSEIASLVAHLEQTARGLLQGSKRARPRKTNRPPPQRPPKALAEVRMMKTLLERHGVAVGATGGDTDGPATRLMARIHEYVTGGEVISHDAIRNRLTRLKEWEAAHQRVEDQHPEPLPN